jgi:quinol monooxygenase YgiN
MSEVVVVVLGRAKPGRGDEAVAAFQDVAVPTLAVVGCIACAVLRVAGDPDRIVLVERWASREALDEHLTTPHLVGFRESSHDLWAEPMEILLVDPVEAADAGKGYLGGA